MFLDLPDAIFRGYEGDEQLLGEPRDDDDCARTSMLRREIARLEPQQVYLPARRRRARRPPAVPPGRDRPPRRGRRWVMPGPEYAGTVVFYEDFPYALVERLPDARRSRTGAFDDLPAGVSLCPAFADITDQIERKITGISTLREPDRAPVRRDPPDGRRRPVARRRRWAARRCRRDPPSATGGRAASDAPSAGWSRADQLIVLVAVVAGTAIRLWLLPMTGLRDDLDQFVGWVHHIATQWLRDALRADRCGSGQFRPGHGAISGRRWRPSSQHSPRSPMRATLRSRVLMKLPATLADYGLAALVAYALRDKPRWAAIGVAAVMLHPVVFYVERLVGSVRVDLRAVRPRGGCRGRERAQRSRPRPWWPLRS